MLKFKHLVMITLSALLICSKSFSETTTKPVNFPMVFQVIQDQVYLDNSMITSATLLTNKDKSFGGLRIRLEPSAAKELTRITSAGVGKYANFVMNGKIVISAVLQTPLQNQFIINSRDQNNIYGISKEEAQAFIDSLHNKQY